MLRSHSDLQPYTLVIITTSGSVLKVKFKDADALMKLAVSASGADCDELISALLANPIRDEVIINENILELMINRLADADRKNSISLIFTWLKTDKKIFKKFFDDYLNFYMEDHQKKIQEKFTKGKKLLLRFIARTYANDPSYANLTTENIPCLVHLIFTHISNDELYIVLHKYFYSSSPDFTQEFARYALAAFTWYLQGDQLAAIMSNLFKEPRLASIFLEADMLFWETLAVLMPTHTPMLCTYYHKLKLTTEDSQTTLLGRAEYEGRKTLTWLQAGDDPNEGLKNFSARYRRQGLGGTTEEAMMFVDEVIRYLEYGAHPERVIDLLVLISSIQNDKWRNEALQRAVKFYIFNLNQLLHVHPDILKFVYLAFPQSKKYVLEKGIGSLLPSRANNWEVISSHCDLIEFTNFLKPDHEVGRNIFLNFCIYLANQPHYPSALNFDVIFLIMKWAGLDKSYRESRSLYTACHQQSALIKEMSQSPGGINVCQSKLADGQINFTFFKSFTSYQHDYYHLLTKLKNKQKRSVKEVLAGQAFSADSIKKLAAMKSGMDAVIASQKQASGMVQKRILQTQLNHSALYLHTKANDNITNAIIDEFEDVSPLRQTLLS